MKEYKCVVCNKKYVFEQIEATVNERIKHERPKSGEQQQMLVYFSHWNRAQNVFNKNNGICFDCYCRERMNEKSEYIELGYSYRGLERYANGKRI